MRTKSAFAIAVLIGLTLGGTAVVAAAGSRPSQVPPAVSEKRQAVLTRVSRRFRLADFCKPRRGDPIDFNYYLAPLICQEIADTNAACRRLFGTVVRDGPSRFHVDERRPTVYAEGRKVIIKGARRDQLVFVWCYGVTDTNRSTQPTAASKGGRRASLSYKRGVPGAQSRQAQTLKAQGLRITLDREGFPAIMEVLADTSGLRLVFVSSRLEEAAARQFGRPLPGCRYAVERPPKEHPNRLVVRAIDDGPAPMGPYVYLDAASQDVVNLRCRCATLQAQKFRKTVAYRFLPLSDLRLLGFRIDFATGTVRYEEAARSKEHPVVPSETSTRSRFSEFPRDRWLRLPSSF